MVLHLLIYYYELKELMSQAKYKKTKLKAYSHSVIFLFATAMQKMDCVMSMRVFTWCDFMYM